VQSYPIRVAFEGVAVRQSFCQKTGLFDTGQDSTKVVAMVSAGRMPAEGEEERRERGCFM